MSIHQKLVVFALCILFNLAAISQDWSLFPLHQKSLYKKSLNGSSIVLKSLVADSIWDTNDTTFIFFNTQFVSHDCLSYEEYLSLCAMNDDSPVIMNDLFIVDHSYYFYSTVWDETKKFHFKTNATINDSWEIEGTGLSITCDSIMVQDIFGVEDSVKTFIIRKIVNNHDYGDRKFILSKSFGLIKFPYFMDLLWLDEANTKMLELKGLQSEQHTLGMQEPEFSDYFHLNAGNVLFWQRHSNPDDITQPETISYYKDSIIEVINCDDSLKYKVNRDYGNGYAHEYIYHIKKSEIEEIIKLPTNWGYFTDYDPVRNHSIVGEEESMLWETLSIYTNDTNYIRSYTWAGLSLWEDNCETDLYFDIGYGFQLDTIYGLAEYCTYSWGFNCETVVGAIINGEHIGRTNVLHSHEIKKQDVFKIYPNPAKQSFYIKSEDNHAINKIECYNLNGELVRVINISNYTNPICFDLPDLKTGMYIIRIVSDNFRSNHRLIIH